MNMEQTKRHTPKYVYDIPYFERMELCRILDQNEKWEELGGVYMNFDVLTIQTLRREILRGNSPTDELLTKWGHQNHTILELFVLLSKMQHYQAMLVIKEFVDSTYHRLIYEGEQNLNRLFKPKQNSNLNSAYNLSQRIPQEINRDKLANIGNGNLDANTEKKIINGQDIAPAEGENANNNCANRSNAQTVLMNRVVNELPNGIRELQQPNTKFLKANSTKDKNASEISSIAESVGILPVITFKELEIATNGWDLSSILGKGGFGTVYKGTWKNTPVAIKRTKNSETNENHSVQIQQILGELKMLNSYRHDNILPLYGFSMDGEDPCLIYQFMPNGSLEDRLLCRHSTKPLSWYQRLNIATGTARGIQFLHTIGEKPLIHGDIKSANILLDSNFEPKIGDFGLAREGPYNHYTHMKVSRVHGTRPYLPDEFLRHKKFSTKVDTHSFGIVLFELGTGLRAYDEQRQYKFLKDLLENTPQNQLNSLVDKKCGSDEQQTFSSLIALGKCCISRKPKDRPEMVLVLQELNALTVKRDMMLKVQNMLRQNNMTPTAPYEMQVYYDLSQQKRISPLQSNATNFRAPTRAISPLQPSFHPDQIFVANNAASLEAQAAAVAATTNPNNPFLPLEPQKQENRDVKTQETKPANPGTSRETEASINVEQQKSMDILGENLQKIPEESKDLLPKTPIISVSPPSGSQSSSVSSEDEATNQSSEQQKSDEDLPYEITSDIENFLPLISVLGVKPKSDPKENERDDEVKESEIENDEVTTSAKGKPLWILDDPS